MQKEKSIIKELTSQLTTAVCGASLVVTVLITIVTYYSEKKKTLQQADNDIAFFIQSQIPSLWHLDDSAAYKICQAFWQRETVAELQLVNSEGDTVFSQSREHTKHLGVYLKDIFYNDEKIGSVNVCITDAVLFKIITQQLIIAIAIIGIIMICQVLITGFMVKKQLFSPLEWLKKMVAMDFVSTKFPSDEHVKVKEFVAFENVLREMGEKIYLDAINKRKSEIALIESEKKYRDIFENSTEGIFQTNSNGHFISCNPAMARMLGYDTTNDVIDKIQNVTTDVYVHPEDRERFKSMLLNYGTVNDLEIEIRRKNGEHAWGTLSARLIVTGDGDITYEGTYRDITERKHAQEQAKIQQQQLIQADKMASLGLLVSGIGHEINNPTNFITLNAPLLKKVWENVAPVLDSHVKVQGDFQISGMSYSTLAPNVPSLIDGILNGAKRIQRIVSDLKEYARPDSNKPTQIVDVNSAVKSAISLMDHKLHKCSDHVNIEIDPRPLTILGNLQRIEQVVINLLHNACDAIKEKQKSITITTGIEEDAYVFIKIADQGEGIKEENIIKLTDPFFTTKRDHGGTGLGLSVSAGIIKEHCGLLKFDSVYGSGTTVTIHLPYVNSKT